MERRAISVPETARVLGISPQTVRNYIASGRLKAAQPAGPGSKFLVTVASIDALLSSTVGAR